MGNANITILGKLLPCGAYVLHLRVQADLQICFGRYQRGKLVDVPVGDYLYIGSAMGQKGSATLARRLLRHASRVNGVQHWICAELSALFACPPPTQKTCRWHIDYLLEETAVSLHHITIIPSQHPQEQAVAQLFNNHPALSALAPGLGATDDRGCTHLLHNHHLALPDLHLLLATI